MITLDFSTLYEIHRSDMARTVVIGRPDAKLHDNVSLGGHSFL